MIHWLDDAPASDFVMGFVGRVNRLPDAYIRPHEVRLCDPGEPGPDRQGATRDLQDTPGENDARHGIPPGPADGTMARGLGCDSLPATSLARIT